MLENLPQLSRNTHIALTVQFEKVDIKKDRRTPEELIDIIEACAKEIEESLRKLKNIIDKRDS